MKVTFPHMGNIYIPIESLVQGMGHDVVVPPMDTKRTLDLGTKYSPDTTCLPFKIIVGNLIEGIDLGADCVLMAGGTGPCRLGYYGEVHKGILEDLGKKVEFITIEPPRGNNPNFWPQLGKLFEKTNPKRFAGGCVLAWAKLNACEELELLALVVRPREREFGSTSRLLKQAFQQIKKAQSLSAVGKLREESVHAVKGLMSTSEKEKVLRVGLVGEIYTVLEPFVNLQIEERLGYLGVEVYRTISLVDWVKNHIFKQGIGLRIDQALRRSAAGYLRGFVGGHGLETVARTVDLAEKDYAGAIHILPMTCMPEIVAQAILPQISEDKHIPVLSLVVDEHTGEAGFQTRLEAFVDLLHRRERCRILG